VAPDSTKKNRVTRKKGKKKNKRGKKREAATHRRNLPTGLKAPFFLRGEKNIGFKGAVLGERGDTKRKGRPAVPREAKNLKARTPCDILVEKRDAQTKKSWNCRRKRSGREKKKEARGGSGNLARYVNEKAIDRRLRWDVVEETAWVL